MVVVFYIYNMCDTINIIIHFYLLTAIPIAIKLFYYE